MILYEKKSFIYYFQKRKIKELNLKRKRKHFIWIYLIDLCNTLKTLKKTGQADENKSK